MIMKAYIHKYKLALLFLFLLISGVARGQQIESMVYNVYDPKYFFACDKATPIDLFKASNLYVSPENGYWGDINGVPYNGKPYKKEVVNNPNAPDPLKERKYTNGNIFTPPISIADTGTYTFYFYFTSPKEYCGIKNGTKFVLNLYLGSLGCLMPISGELFNAHSFCFNSSVDLSLDKYEFSKPVTVGDLLFEHLEDVPDDPNDPDKPDRSKWQRLAGDSKWVPIEVYSDRELKNRVNEGELDMNVRLDSAYNVTYYLLILGHNHKYTDSINIIVYPESKLEIFYSPDIINDINKTYDIDDQITIKVDTSGEYKFRDYTFMLNNTNLNKYYLGGDITKNEITLGALAFSGVEDFIKIIATDIHNCIVQTEENVVVPVPFPTVFTPDGDGINDIFFGGEKFRNREFHLEVSNRWGSLLYSGESGWDGTYRGNKVPAGTYLYVLILKTDKGSSRTVKGTVTLIRENR
jgi:gliding motility-associated-like protein